MRKIWYKSVIVCIIQLLIISSIPFQSTAATPPIPITLSKIGNSTSWTCPAQLLPEDVTGCLIDGEVYIKTSDISEHFTCTVVTSNSSYVSIIMNGQETRAYKNSSYYTSHIDYTVYATPTTTKNYEFFGSGNLDYGSYAARLFNGYWYVALDIMKSLGVLLIYTATLDEYTVFDFRANPGVIADNNDYIVGGPWIQSGYCYQLGTTKPANTDWADMEDHQLSPNFKIRNIQDHSTSSQNPNCYSQLKAAVDLLSSAQQVRYVNNNNSSLTFSCAYRSWWYNKYVGGWYASFHMRGRAYDAPEDALYYDVKDDFKGSHTTPIPIGTSYWRRQPEVSWSIGDEIETMPRDGSYWLHMQVDPSAQVSPSIAPVYP